MPALYIRINSLRVPADTPIVIAQFLAGVLVGVLLGLAAAPFLRAWVSWKMTEVWRQSDEQSDVRTRIRSRS
jgi:hypothetical protein